MATVDLEFAIRREQNIRLAVRRSSPALIWSGDAGIHIVAVNRTRSDNRIYKALDRFAAVTRGLAVDGSLIARGAIQVAYGTAAQRSRGGVHGRHLVESVAHAVAERFHNYLSAPLSAEMVLVQLNAAPDQDYLAHLNYRGEASTFEKAFFLGSVKPDVTNQQQDETAFEKIQEQLQGAWEPGATLARISDIFRALPIVGETPGLGDTFAKGRLEVVLLDRTALAERRFADIFKRLDI